MKVKQISILSLMLALGLAVASPSLTYAGPSGGGDHSKDDSGGDHDKSNNGGGDHDKSNNGGGDHDKSNNGGGDHDKGSRPDPRPDPRPDRPRVVIMNGGGGSGSTNTGIRCDLGNRLIRVYSRHDCFQLGGAVRHGRKRITAYGDFEVSGGGGGYVTGGGYVQGGGYVGGGVYGGGEGGY